MGIAKAQRLEARLTAEQRAQIEQAAALTGETVSAFVVLAAVERAESVVSDRMTTVVPAAYFDRLIASLDEPDPVPRLRHAAGHADRRAQIDHG